MMRNGVARLLTAGIPSVGMSLILQAAPQALAAQDAIQAGACRRATVDVDTIIEQIERVAAGATLLGRASRTHAMYEAVAAPFSNNSCPRLRPDVDRGSAIRQLLDYAADHENEELAGPVMKIASETASRYQDEFGWNPADFLFRVLEMGRTSAARSAALYHLTEQATDPAIRGRLVGIARRAAGPSVWPDLPSDLLDELQYMPWEGARLLRSEMISAPNLLRNPRAKWQAECSRDHPRPMLSDDRCHPRNAPPRAVRGR